MATVTSLTAGRMIEIEASSVVSGLVDASGHLMLTTHGGAVIDAGYVVGPEGPEGPQGEDGPPGSGGGGGGGGYTRTTTVITGTGYKTDALAAGYRIMSIQCSVAHTRVRIYTTAAQRAADASRPFIAPPQGGAVMFDYLFTSTTDTPLDILVDAFRPTGEAVVYFNIEGTAGTVTLTWIRTE